MKKKKQNKNKRGALKNFIKLKVNKKSMNHIYPSLTLEHRTQG